MKAAHLIHFAAFQCSGFMEMAHSGGARYRLVLRILSEYLNDIEYIDAKSFLPVATLWLALHPK